MRGTWLVLVAVLALAGCTSEVVGAPAKGTAPAAGPVDLVVPIELRPVIEAPPPGPQPSSTTPPSVTGSASPSGEQLPGPDGEVLSLADPVIVIDRLDGAEVENVDGRWALNIDLTDQDGSAFADWTAAHVGERLAIVVDGEVVVAPEIQSAITGGEVQISGDYTRDDVQDLLDEITGR